VSRWAGPGGRALSYSWDTAPASSPLPHGVPGSVPGSCKQRSPRPSRGLPALGGEGVFSQEHTFKFTSLGRLRRVPLVPWFLSCLKQSDIPPSAGEGEREGWVGRGAGGGTGAFPALPPRSAFPELSR